MWFYLALLSAFFNALSNIARRTHGSLAQPVELAWWTGLFSLPLGIGMVIVSNQRMWTSDQYLVPAIVLAVLSAYGHVLLFRAYKYADASVASPLSNLLPVLLIGTSFLMLGILPSMAGLGGILLVVAGLYYSSVSGKHSLTHPLRQILKNRGSRAMVGWVILMSFNAVLAKVALESVSAEYLMLFVLVVDWIILSIYLLVRTTRQSLLHGKRVIRRWGWHIAAIAVFSTLNVFFMYKAIDLINPSYALAVKRLDVLFTIVLAGLFLKEKHILRRLKGSILAFVGVIIVYFAA